MDDAVLEMGKGSSRGTMGWRYIVTTNWELEVISAAETSGLQHHSKPSSISPVMDGSRAPTELQIRCCVRPGSWLGLPKTWLSLWTKKNPVFNLVDPALGPRRPFRIPLNHISHPIHFQVTPPQMNENRSRCHQDTVQPIQAQ